MNKKKMTLGLPPEDTSRRMLTVCSVSNRGWTPAMIRDWLGDPNASLEERDAGRKTAPYRTVNERQLYWEDRVIAAESSDAFRERLALAGKRRTQAQKAAAGRAENLRKWARTVDIEWQNPPRDTERALETGLHHWQRRSRHSRSDGKDADSDTRKRWARNYIRHRCMKYEALLDETSTKPGVREAYAIIRDRCDEMIDERYPELDL